jgi:transcriptional regulator with XRE-family HTH domain
MPHTAARLAVLELVGSGSEQVPIGRLRQQLSAHQHAADRAVRELTAEGQLVVGEVIVADRLGRPRVALAVAPASAPGRGAIAGSTLPRFSGADLRRARLTARVPLVTLARQLHVTESAVRWWERSAVVPPARSREIVYALARLRRQDAGIADARTAAQLREARRAAGWTQARLARALRVSQSTISNWESGEGLDLKQARRVYRLLRSAAPAAEMEPDELHRLRTRRGWSQSLMAERLGVSRATIRRWEAGEVRIPPRRIPALRGLVQT